MGPKALTSPPRYGVPLSTNNNNNKVHKEDIMKKVVKNIPFVTIILVIANVIVTRYFNTTTITDGFGAADVLAIFSHADGGHIAYNMGMLFTLGSMAELLLRNRRWIYISMVMVAIVASITEGELRNTYRLGASGWVSAVPFILVFAGLLFWYENRRNECEYLGRFGAIIGSVFGFGGLIIDYALSQDKVHMSITRTDHIAHISGQMVGIVLALIASAAYGAKLLKK